MTVLVVGGNGQLGAAICDGLLERGRPVRASVRSLDRGAFLRDRGIDVVLLDLASGQGQEEALADVDTVVLSANSAVPRAGDDPAAVEAGLARLVADAGARGVERIVLPSVPTSSVDQQVPLVAARRRLEQQVREAVPQCCILSLPPFMEAWLALVGSSLPLRGEPHATIGRPSPFLRTFRRATGTLVETRGVMLVPGPVGAENAFISVRDAARASVEAVCRAEPTSEVDVAGPQVLTWRDVAEVFERVLGRKVRVLSTPAAVYAAAARLLAPVAEVPARTMALNRYLASAATPWPDAGGGLVPAATMTTVEEFLRHKASLPSALPSVT
jgi:uncharacterized protein YbjT (DUF2867 family)